jgi:SAM-dependent methyltransferase
MTTRPEESLLRRAGRRLPGPIRDALWKRTTGRASQDVHWGNLRRTEPFSRQWGAERGLPVDRIYIERFLERHAGDIRGEALEIHGSQYTRQFGGDRVATAHVLDVDASNPAATIVGDLAEPATLPEGRFDCVVLTQTLQFVADAEAAVANAYRSLAPGGVLLLTVPCVSQLEQGWDDFWRWTPRGFELFLRRALTAGARLDIVAYGNVLTSIAFLLGLAAEDLTRDEYAVEDGSYPLVVCARVERMVT